MHISNGVLIDKLQRALGNVGSRVLLLSDQTASASTTPPVAVPGMKPAARLAPNVWGYGAGSTLMVCASDFTALDLPLLDRQFVVLFDFVLPGLNAFCDYRVERPSNSGSARVLAECRVGGMDPFRMRVTVNAAFALPLSYACGMAANTLLNAPAARWMIEGGPREVRLINVLGKQVKITVPFFAPKLLHEDRVFAIHAAAGDDLTYYESR